MSLAYKSAELKRELQHLNNAELTALCLRFARFKKENKELLTYLLFKADDPDAFVQEYKAEMDEQFKTIPGKSFHAVKTLRKIAKLLNNQTRYAGLELVTTELLLHYCQSYIGSVNHNTSYKPLRSIFFRMVDKLKASILKLPEDLQYDYSILYEKMLAEAQKEIYWFEEKLYLL